MLSGWADMWLVYLIKEPTSLVSKGPPPTIFDNGHITHPVLLLSISTASSGQHPAMPSGHCDVAAAQLPNGSAWHERIVHESVVHGRTLTYVRC